MTNKRIFIVNQVDDSQKYGVGKYINEIIEEAKYRKNDFDLISILIGASNTIQVEKNQIDNVTHLKIPKPIFHKGSFQSLRYFYSRSVFVLLNEFYQFDNTDTFHFNSNMQHFLIACIKEYTKAKIIYTIHVSLWKTYYNNDFNKFISEFRDSKNNSVHKKNINVEVENCELSDQVICLSESMENDVSEIYGIPKQKIYKIPNGIKKQKVDVNDINEIKRIEKKLNIDEKDFIFLYVGRLNPQKGVVDLIKSFKEILQDGYKNIKLLLIGDGIIRESLIKKSSNFKQEIIFVGYISTNQVKLYYRLARVLIFPSLNEQSSYVMLEAMSYKVPMIVTEADIFKMLQNEYSCLKIGLNKENELDGNSFKELIKAMLQSKELRHRIAENAYNLYINNYSSKMMFNKTYLS